MRFPRLPAMLVLIWLLVPNEATAQQVTVGTPFHGVSDSFFEHIGTSWGFNFKGVGVQFGSPNMAAPQFGGFDPAAGINGGFGFGGGGRSGFFNFGAQQGFRQNFVSQTPSVTLTNGYPGFISDSSVSPFVIGYVPVVAGFPVVPMPYANTAFPGQSVFAPGGQYSTVSPGNSRIAALRQQLAEGGPAPRKEFAEKAADIEPAAQSEPSSASRSAPSVAEARRMHRLEQAQQSTEAEALYERALTAEEKGKPNVAKIYYRMAAKRAPDELRREIETRLRAIDTADK